MSSKKSSGSKNTIGVMKFEPRSKVRRPGRHAKNKRPVNQTFFPRQKGR